jgi:hypothetical protein
MVDYPNATIPYGGSTITLLDFVKNNLCINDSSQDDDLSLYIQIAGEAAERYTDNVLGQDTVTEYIAAAYSPVALRYWPFVSLTSVVEDKTGITDDTDETDVTEDWQVFVTDGVAYAKADGRCGTSWNQLKITYVAGYDPLPVDLANVIAMAGISFGQNVTGAVKKESVVGVGSIEYVTDDISYGAFTSASLMVLDKYKRWHA